MPHPLISQIDHCIRRDPAQRGLIGTETRFGPLCPGHLAAASADLASRGKRVAIVTGFYIPRGAPPAAETDGPPGALLLAQGLLQAGISAEVVTDRYCLSAVAITARAMGFPASRIVEYPHPAEWPSNSEQASAAGSLPSAAWRADFFRSRPDLTHLIAIERAGPSHTADSVQNQTRNGPAPMEDFLGAVPEVSCDHCHNMRGEVIDQFTGDLHRLFEDVETYCPQVRTIGIGDGANEIGMGVVPWEELTRRLSGEQAPRVPCRVPCNWNIVAGTSNWGGQALVAATLLELGQAERLRPFDADQQEQVLIALVNEGPAVDGVTRRQEPSVDGIPYRTYIQPWEAIRSLLGLT